MTTGHFGQVTSHRIISVVGDAELDEGNVWEAIIDESLQGLGNLLLIVDPKKALSSSDRRASITPVQSVCHDSTRPSADPDPSTRTKGSYRDRTVCLSAQPGISWLPVWCSDCPLGVDRFGQSGSQADLYQYTEIGVKDIVSAGYLAWELGENH